jgi:DNA replication protein DnaC
VSAAQASDASARIAELCGAFKLPTIGAELCRRLVDGGFAAALDVVVEVFEMEAHDRHERRVERLRRASKLPPGKTFGTLDEAKLPRAVLHKARELSAGAFLDDATNVLLFGLPGRGKSHLACAIGHALVERGHAVLFAPTYELVQQLLAAKRDLALPSMLRKLDVFDAIVLDDIGYVQQSADEAEVLFTLLAERYERRSIVITSNLVFSDWERIFKNPLSTMAAIDRLVHHSVILEFDGPSVRAEEAQRRQRGANNAVEPKKDVDEKHGGHAKKKTDGPKAGKRDDTKTRGAKHATEREERA